MPSHKIGLAIRRPLLELDEVIYLRFASVYRAFISTEDSEEISALRARHVAVGTPPASRTSAPPVCKNRRSTGERPLTARGRQVPGEGVVK